MNQEVELYRVGLLSTMIWLCMKRPLTISQKFLWHFVTDALDSDFRLCKTCTVDKIHSLSLTRTKLELKMSGPIQFPEYAIFCSFCVKIRGDPTGVKIMVRNRDLFLYRNKKHIKSPLWELWWCFVLIWREMFNWISETINKNNIYVINQFKAIFNEHTWTVVCCLQKHWDLKAVVKANNLYSIKWLLFFANNFININRVSHWLFSDKLWEKVIEISDTWELVPELL